MNRYDPEAQGVSSQTILDFIEELDAQKFDMHSFILTRHSRVIAEAWWHPYGPECRQTVYSMSKSFTSTGVGFAVSEGLLKVDDPVISFFPDELPEEVSANLAAMRVRDLLTMTSGHDFDSLAVALEPGAEHWVRGILALPVNEPPGTFFLYNTGATYLLSAIIQKVTGKTLFEYLQERLFEPLGITDVAWDVCPQGITCGGWGLYIHSRDIAKFGQLYLQKGVWNGQRLLPAEWIEEATVFPHPPLTEDHLDEADWHQGYGYQFWGCQHDSYRADGAMGQFCIVLQEQDAVITITSETQNMQGIMNLVWKHLFPAMKDSPLPPDPKLQGALADKLSSLALRPFTSAVKPAKTGRMQFNMAENGLGLQSLDLDYFGKECAFSLTDAGGKHVIACGDGEWLSNTTRIPGMLPTLFTYLHDREKKPVSVAASGGWSDEHTYRMRWQYLMSPHYDLVTCRVEDGRLDLRFETHFGEMEAFLLPGIENHFTGTLQQALHS